MKCFLTVNKNPLQSKVLLVMKLTTLLTFFLTLNVAANGFGQEKINLKVKKTEISGVLRSIEKQTIYRFLYNDKLEDIRDKVSLTVKDVDINEALSLLLDKTRLLYQMMDNNLIVIKENPNAPPRVPDVVIRGKITAEGGAPLAGVSVQVKGTTAGTSTNNDGVFVLNLPNANVTLVITSVGYDGQEIDLAGKTEINISLVASTKIMDQVVVVGYGTQRKVDVTGSVAQVKGDEIVKQASYNPLSALQGKVAGVQITNLGAPGAPPQVTIRGIGTVYGNTNPLFVVDGVWYDDISFLNSSDIENISVLKDASSESIYGIRAANGVILVTTKKGRQNGRTVINYNGFVGNQVVTNQVAMASGAQYAELINEVDVLAGSPGRYDDPSSFGTTDWYHQILRNALVTNHQVSITGGGEKSNYNFSLGYYYQDGLVKNNNFDRYSTHFSNDYQLAKFLKIGVNVTGILSKSNDLPGSIFYDVFNAAPIVPVYYADGSYGDAGDYNIAAANRKNPQVSIDIYDQQTKNWKLNGSVYADLKFLKYFTFHTSAGGEYTQGETNNYSPYTNYLYIPVAYRNTHSTLSRNRSENRNWIIENTLSFEKKFNDHSVKVLVGQAAQEYKYYQISASIFNVPNIPGGQYISLGTDTTASVSDVGSLSRVNSYFGRVNYSFQDKYLFNASLRADGSSKFSQNWGYFPSVGVGWVISKEKFMEQQDLFDNLKLRGSWGRIGNMSVPANISVLRAAQTGELVYIGGNGSPATGASINSVVTPTTEWELGEGIDIGVEASLLRNKLYVEIDWYNRKTKNAIFDIPVLGSVGTSSGTIIGNQATFENQGFEFLVTWKEAINKDWSYSINANAGINKNNVSEVSTGANPIYQYLGTSVITRTVVGQPIGQFYGRHVIGIFQSAADVASYKGSGGGMIQPTAKPGDFKFEDVNKDGVIDDKDRKVLGNPNPKLVYGINTTVGFKNFDLTLDFQGVSGIEIYNGNFATRFGGENYTKDFYDNRWHGEGTSNLYPSVSTAGNSTVTSDFFIEDGSYFRVRNAQLGYTFGKSGWIQRAGISKLRVYANAQNPFTFFKYRGFTPELPAGSPTRSGIDQNVYPLYATYNFGINLTF
jgi:TonB-linked SusC/RagA family outer membrane protein